MKTIIQKIFPHGTPVFSFTAPLNNKTGGCLEKANFEDEEEHEHEYEVNQRSCFRPRRRPRPRYKRPLTRRIMSRSPSLSSPRLGEKLF